MMNLISKIKYCFKLRDLYLVKEVIKKNVNWLSFFLDFFSLTRGNFIIFQMRNGLKYMVRARTWDRGVITRIHLADEYSLSQLSLPKDSTIIDIGAHIGIFSIFISKNVNQVFSFEPIPENYSLFKKNIQLNMLEGKIHAFNLAISDIRGKINISLSPINTAGHSEYEDNKNHITVNAITLKDVFNNNNIKKCDLLKIDTEGAEYKILYSLTSDYFKIIKIIVFEYHNINSNNNSFNFNSLISFLNEHNFKVSKKEAIITAINQKFRQ